MLLKNWNSLKSQLSIKFNERFFFSFLIVFWISYHYIFIYVGYKNLNKAPTSRVISMAEESIAKPKRPHARTSRPCQWHIARGCPTTEKRVRRRASPDMTEGVVATPTFNASHQTSWLHLCREDPWTVLSWSSQLTRGWRRHLMGQALKWCSKGLTNGRPGSPEGSYIM